MGTWLPFLNDVQGPLNKIHTQMGVYQKGVLVVGVWREFQRETKHLSVLDFASEVSWSILDSLPCAKRCLFQVAEMFSPRSDVHK